MGLCHGIFDEKIEIYDDNHNMIYTGSVKDGLYNGYGKKYSHKIQKSGEIISYLEYEGYFLNGKYHNKGILYEYIDIGDKHIIAKKYEGNFSEGKCDGYGMMYATNIKRIVFTDGPQYTYKYFMVYKGEFRNGLYNGKGKFYTKYRNYKGNYVDGKKNGEFFHYYSDGNIEKKETYKDDKLHGEYISYCHKTSRVVLSEMYEKGEKHGPTKEYWHTSYKRIKSLDMYKNGKKDGLCVKYDSNINNKKYEGEMYKNGIKIRSITYLHQNYLYINKIKDMNFGYGDTFIFIRKNGSIKFWAEIYSKNTIKKLVRYYSNSYRFRNYKNKIIFFY